MTRQLIAFALIAYLTPSLAAAQAMPPAPPPASSPANVTVIVPEGVLIPTHLSEPMDSGKVHTGDLFEFVVGRDIVVDNYIVIPANSKGVGHVTDAHSAGSHGKSGGLRLAFDYLFAVDGTQLPVAHNAEASNADNGGGVAAAMVLGILTFGVGGLFAHNFVHGQNVTISETIITNVATLANKSVTLDGAKYSMRPQAVANSVPAQ